MGEIIVTIVAATIFIGGMKYIAKSIENDEDLNIK